MTAEKLSLPHLTFYPELFEREAKDFPEHIRKEARELLEEERAVAESSDWPDMRDTVPSGHSLRASPSGTVEAARQLTALLSAYRQARREYRAQLKQTSMLRKT